MAYLFSPALVDSTSALKWRFQIIEPSAMSKLTDTVKESLCLECETEALTPRQSGMTLPHSTGDRGVDEWILSLEGSLVKTCQLLVSEMGLEEIGAGFGGNMNGLLLKRDLHWSLLKTCKDLFSEDCEMYSGTWRSWGTMQNGVVFLPHLSVLPTFDKDSSFWPTPTRNMITGGPNHTAPTVIAGRHGINLKGAVVKRGTKWIPNGIMNPPWIEWLMGLILGWTDLAPSEMQWFRNKPRKRGKSSQEEPK